MRGDEFGQIVEYVTTDGIHDVSVEAFDLASMPALEAVKGDYEKVAALGRPKTLDVNAVRAAVSEVYHQDVIDNEIVSTDPVEIVSNLIAVRSRPEWSPGVAVSAGDVYFYAGNLYVVRDGHDHTTQSDWPPDATPALWKRFYEPEEGPQPWVQPLGEHDAYQKGDRVTHNGKTWESTLDANVWEPGVFGWVEV